MTFTEIRDRLNPLVWGQFEGVYSLGGGLIQIHMSGILRVPGGMPSEPAKIRAALFESAQAVIKTVEDAGYRHDEAPHIDIDGEVYWCREGVQQIRAEGRIELWLKPPGS